MTKTRTGWFRMSFHRAGRKSVWHFCGGEAHEQSGSMSSEAQTSGGEFPVAVCGYVAWHSYSEVEWNRNSGLSWAQLPGNVCLKCTRSERHNNAG